MMNPDIVTTISGIVRGVAVLLVSFGINLPDTMESTIIKATCFIYAVAIMVHGFYTNKKKANT